jgi:paraquat-inducible protein A
MANAGVLSSRRNIDPILTACPECDLVQREPECLDACAVSCRRCGALLYRSVPKALDITLALTLATAIAFTIANILPVMSLELQGRQVSPTLFGLVRALNDAGMAHIGILVLMTIILMPGLEILARLYLLVPLRVGRVPRGIALVSQLLGSIKVWSMTEVFVLGAVASIHRLRQIAELEIEPGFWAISAVMVLIAMTDSVFDTRALWARAAGKPT